MARVKAILWYSRELCDAAISGARTGMRESLQRLHSFNLCVVSWSAPFLSPSRSFLSSGGCGMEDKSPDSETAGALKKLSRCWVYLCPTVTVNGM